MEHFLTTLPGIIVAWTAITTGIIAGALYVIGLIKGKKDNADDRLIGILQETVTALEKKVDEQKKEYDEDKKKLDTEKNELIDKVDKLTIKVDTLEKENKTLIEILQGKDEATTKFYEKAFESIEIGKQTHELVVTMSKQHAELMSMLVEHLIKKPTVNITNQK